MAATSIAAAGGGGGSLTSGGAGAGGGAQGSAGCGGATCPTCSLFGGGGGGGAYGGGASLGRAGCGGGGGGSSLISNLINAYGESADPRTPNIAGGLSSNLLTQWTLTPWLSPGNNDASGLVVVSSAAPCDSAGACYYGIGTLKTWDDVRCLLEGEGHVSCLYYAPLPPPPNGSLKRPAGPSVRAGSSRPSSTR